MVVVVAAPLAIPCQSQAIAQISASSSASTSRGSHGGQQAAWRRSEFCGSSRNGLIGEAGEQFARSSRRVGQMCVRAEGGFNFWEVLGGRGLKGGEKGTNTEEGLKALFSDPEGSGKKNKKAGADADGRVEVSGVDGFNKELSGLVGGFPGGEKGLQKFLQEYPPPPKKGEASKASQELEKLLGVLSEPAGKPKTIIPPLLMPGMTVVVKEPRHPFYMYTGIVQRITDGKAGVLFEGGNWDKLISFKLTDLERTARGPPMINPKSAVLLEQQAPVSPPP